jgi:AraC-like DNA-binding protein
MTKAPGRGSDRSGKAPARLVLSSDELPAGLDDRARMQRWQEIREGISGAFEDTHADDRPFSARLEVARFGSAVVVEFSDTLVRTARTARYIAADGSDNFLLAVNAGRGPLLQRQRGREAMLAPGALTLFSNADAGEVCCAPGSVRRLIMVPRARLARLISSADDHVARMMEPNLPAARLLRRYLAILLGPDGVEDDPLLDDHVATTLLDLIALALGAGRDAAQFARQRGRRAALVREVVAAIGRGFADPSLSPERVASKLGLSLRHVQDLLHETGRSFSERVMELRLQRARAMLANPRCDRLKVIEIAHACGFNEVSHFNRCFRHRFDDTPSHYRGNDAR